MNGNAKIGGFTLLEVVVTMAVIAILGASLYVFFSAAFTRGHIPVLRLKKTSELHVVMENITARYDELPIGTPAETLQFELGGPLTPHAIPAAFLDGISGPATVVDNRFVEFDEAHNETADTTAPYSLLKVTIQNELGETLTTLFTN